MKKKTLWSSKNSVSHKPLKKKKARQEYNSHSPRSKDQSVYFEYSTPNKGKKTRLGQTQEFTPSRFQSKSYSTIGGFNQPFSESKRTQKEFRIQRSSRSKGSKAKLRPPLYTNLGPGVKPNNEISTKLLR